MPSISPITTEIDPAVRADNVTPTHPGKFFEIGPEQLRWAKFGGYRRIGVGVVLLNPNGQILAVEHKGNHKVKDHMLGINSETLSGFWESGGVRAESIINCIGRCIKDELKVNPSGIRATTRLSKPFARSDWPAGVDPSLGEALGVNVALLLDDEGASAVANMSETDEVYRTYFVDPDYLMEADAAVDLRPGTARCLKGLGEVGLLDIGQLTDARLTFPLLEEPQFDIDLDRVK